MFSLAATIAAAVLSATGSVSGASMQPVVPASVTSIVPVPVPVPTPAPTPVATVPRVVKAVPAVTRVPAGASVGPLFPGGVNAPHSCTASVVASPAGNVLVTAAHCVSGTERGVVFAPGYRNGAFPYGAWVVTAAYVAPAWLSSQDPLHDYAFLTVRPASSNSSAASVQSVVGAPPLVARPASGSTVTVTGYGTGSNDVPVVCTSTVTTTLTGTAAYPTFNCAGYVDGTSGSPWVSAAGVTGVIGGLHQGGCLDEVSYSAPFDGDTTAVFTRAVDNDEADNVPAAGPDGC